MKYLFNIREYKEGDEKEIISLFNQIFVADRDKKYWQWQYIENPVKKPVIIIAEDDSGIVGQCTLLPTYMIVKDKEMLSGQSIDTMLKEGYRGKGIHKEMANKSYEIGIGNGIRFRIGFPSQLAIRGLLGGIGGSFVTDINLYISPYKIDNFLISIVKSKFIAKVLSIPAFLIMKIIFREAKLKIRENYTFKEVNEFNEEFDKLWDKIKINSQIMSKRDSKFLNWRIKEHPKIDYKTFGAYFNGELAGYVILKVEVRSIREKYEIKLGSIVDIVGINEEVVSALYYKSKEFFKQENTDFVVAWITDSMKYRDLFTKLGFIKSKSKIPFVVKDLTDNKELEKFITNEENWYLMPIESDFY